jgi:hypothetical protein
MDLTSDVDGAQVVAASSFDPKFPPSNILDGYTGDIFCIPLSHRDLVVRETSTKWITSGMYPQEIIVQLATTSVISRVKTWTTNGTPIPQRRS